jgi:hypothetical protein
MRIRVPIAVEVDPREWVAEYGCDPTEVREDVHAQVRYSIDASPAPMKVVIGNAQSDRALILPKRDSPSHDPACTLLQGLERYLKVPVWLIADSVPRCKQCGGGR